MASPVRSYGKYEFCKNINCPGLMKSKIHMDQVVCREEGTACLKSAKELHKWLSKEGFMILKKM